MKEILCSSLIFLSKMSELKKINLNLVALGIMTTECLSWNAHIKIIGVKS